MRTISSVTNGNHVNWESLESLWRNAECIDCKTSLAHVRDESARADIMESCSNHAWIVGGSYNTATKRYICHKHTSDVTFLYDSNTNSIEVIWSRTIRKMGYSGLYQYVMPEKYRIDD